MFDDAVNWGTTLTLCIGLIILSIISFSQRGRLNCIDGAMNASKDGTVSVETIEWCKKNF